MNSEEYKEIQNITKDNRLPNDEGPFYHHTFWEAYKGSVKGKLGGALIGTLLGATVGILAVAVLPATALAGISIMTVIGGFAAAGMVYGSHEFSEVGRVTGAIAAAEKSAEIRMQNFEKSKFSEIRQDINELKSMLNNTATSETNETIATIPRPNTGDSDIDSKLGNYRTTHYNSNTNNSKNNSIIIWKVALAGLIIGAVVGILLATSGASAGLADFGLGALLENPATSAITFGLVGTSFGVNRDIFRKIFDKTDLLFKGVSNWKQKKQPEVEKLQNINASKDYQQVNTLVYKDSGIDYPTSETFHQDRVIANAKQLLAAMDHTTASRH